MNKEALKTALYYTCLDMYGEQRCEQNLSRKELEAAHKKMDGDIKEMAPRVGSITDVQLEDIRREAETKLDTLFLELAAYLEPLIPKVKSGLPSDELDLVVAQAEKFQREQSAKIIETQKQISYIDLFLTKRVM